MLFCAKDYFPSSIGQFKEEQLISSKKKQKQKNLHYIYLGETFVHEQN